MSSVEQRSDLVNITSRKVFENQKDCTKLSDITSYVEPKKEGDKVDCLVYGNDVRLDDIGSLARDQLRRKLKAIFLTLLTIMFGMMLIIYVQRTVSAMMLSSPWKPSSPSPPPDVISRRGLSHHEHLSFLTRRLCGPSQTRLESGARSETTPSVPSSGSSHW